MVRRKDVNCVSNVSNTCPAPAAHWYDFAMLLTRQALLASAIFALGAPLTLRPVVAAEPEDRAQLSACVEKNMTADDSLIMRRFIFLFMSDVMQTDADIQGDVAAKRDALSTGAAGLITRLAEKDCKAEVHALIADKPQGGAFKSLFDDIGKPVQSSLTMGLPKAAIALGMGIMKKLDPATLADLEVIDLSGAAGPAAAPAAQTNPRSHLSRAAVSGVRLRVLFETSLNPDCSVVGPTVIRALIHPTQGTATIENAKDFTNYDATNQRYHCNVARVAGAAVYYQSKPGYTGPDSASYEVITPSGLRRQIDVDINVN